MKNIIRDHCNFAGKYEDAAYSIRNLKYNVSKKAPIVFHNGSNYDDHFHCAKSVPICSFSGPSISRCSI